MKTGREGLRYGGGMPNTERAKRVVYNSVYVGRARGVVHRSVIIIIMRMYGGVCVHT